MVKVEQGENHTIFKTLDKEGNTAVYGLADASYVDCFKEYFGSETQKLDCNMHKLSVNNIIDINATKNGTILTISP